MPKFHYLPMIDSQLQNQAHTPKYMTDAMLTLSRSKHNRRKLTLTCKGNIKLHCVSGSILI